ncbi:MAG TPA: xyloglucanase, partial [Terracidiphilus sp.]|nr:xyloglucanase [Terracidiphilus sp.]
MKPARSAASLLLAASFLAPAAVAQTPSQAAYTWKNVQIVGGGFVDGIVFDPTVPGLRYARTDIGGAYRWDESAHRWQPLLDWVPYKDRNLMGVASIAIDPSDPNRVYLACGTYTNADAPNGAILRSTDQGRTFARTDVPFKFGANEDGRGNGERLAVDPRDGRILYLGTRHDGLWRSRDRGVTWVRVASFPDVAEPAPPRPKSFPGETPEQRWKNMPVRGDGIVFIHFDPTAAPQSPASATQTIYVGVSLINRPNLFVTHDGGATWSPIPGEPSQYRPTRAALAADGFLYVAYGTAPGPSRMTNGALWKLDTHTGQWTDITPDRPVAGSRQFGYAAVAVDPHHPRTLIASTFGRPGGDGLFRSTDGGATWRSLFGGPRGGLFDYSLAPYVKATPIHWLFDIEIDPTNPNHAVFTTGYGGWETHDLADADRGLPTHWSILAEGIEETVALALDSPAQGAHLISAIGDYGGFVHWRLGEPAAAGSSAPPRMANTTDVVSAASRPSVIVRVGIDAVHGAADDLGYSLDQGRTWTPAPSEPAPHSRSGSIAVSANGAVWLWTPQGEGTYRTTDRGASWSAVEGLPHGLRVDADPIDPRVFYAVSLGAGRLYRSSDAGAMFTSEPLTLSGDPPGDLLHAQGDPRGGENRLYATPGRSGDLWLPTADGLYHLSKPLAEGESPVQTAALARLPGVTAIQAFGFGKAAPHANYPALYLAGTVDGQPGVFRSIDEGKTWARINDDRHQWGLILQIAGDPRVYGR